LEQAALDGTSTLNALRRSKPQSPNFRTCCYLTKIHLSVGGASGRTIVAQPWRSPVLHGPEILRRGRVSDKLRDYNGTMRIAVAAVFGREAL
jgi:hypothetical protein